MTLGYGGDVDGCRRHDEGRGGLVAPGGEDDTVDGIAVQDFDQAQVLEISIQRRGGSFAAFLYGVDGKLDGYAADLADAVSDSVSQPKMNPVARNQIAAGLGDTDDRLSGAKLGRGDTEVSISLDM